MLSASTVAEHTALGSGTVCRKSGTPARQETARSGRPTFRNRKLYHYPALVLLANIDDDGSEMPTSESSPIGLIEIGWILAGPFDQQDLRAIREARRLLLASLAIQLPDFTWRNPVVQRPELVKEFDVEPTELIRRRSGRARSAAVGL